MNGTIVEKAMIIALYAHEGQMRKGTNTPYIVHPVRVALLLAKYGFDDEVIAAGLVHDVVEDTSLSLSDIKNELGENVANLVAPVTHDDTLSWDEKKKAYIESVRNANDSVKAISTTDKIANAESLIALHEKEGRAVWKHFNVGRERKLWFEEAMLEMLQESWKCPIVDEYAKAVEKLKALD